MTQKERLRIYEQFMHHMSMYVTTMKSEKIQEGVRLMDSWSYAHRCGNGELSEREQRKLVDAVVRRMEKY